MKNLTLILSLTVFWITSVFAATDAEIKQQLVGAWIWNAGAANESIETLHKDGVMTNNVYNANRGYTAIEHWGVRNGEFLTWFKGAEGDPETYKIVTLNETKFTFKMSNHGGHRTETWTRKAGLK
jgi:hypothetical protein